MSVPLYMDVHVPGPVVRGLRSRGVDVLTAWEDGTQQLSDRDLLGRATALGRVLVTQDADLFAEATALLQSGQSFSGLAYAHQLRITIGQMIADLELVAKINDPPDMVDRIEFLPL